MPTVENEACHAVVEPGHPPAFLGVTGNTTLSWIGRQLGHASLVGVAVAINASAMEQGQNGDFTLSRLVAGNAGCGPVGSAQGKPGLVMAGHGE